MPILKVAQSADKGGVISSSAFKSLWGRTGHSLVGSAGIEGGAQRLERARKRKATATECAAAAVAA